ncbi:MAG: sugar transferase [Bacteroidales bacterium]|nr:sugar transferase [Bacteroidales bacterium]
MTTLAPIIVFCYNRPWHVEQTLEALSCNELADQSILYIYCDGPKADASAEQRQKITDVRHVVRKRQWCKEVSIVEAEHNKGLANSIIDGVSDVINKHGKVFVLEDDLVSSPYMLKYVNTALDFYEDYAGVFSVSVNRPPLSKMQIPKDYPFDVFACLRSYSTGWGTWKDRWNKVDWSMDDFDRCKQNSDMLRALCRLGDDFPPMMQLLEDGKIDSWAVRFSFAHFKFHAVAILPCKSYVTNIGFDGTGTHSGTVANVYENDLSESVLNPRMLEIVYEDDRIINAFYSAFTLKRRPLWQKLINYIARKFGKKPPFVIKKKVYV